MEKNKILKSLMETHTVALEAITDLKEKELPNVTYKQQIQQHHQGHQNNFQKVHKILSNSRITMVNFNIRDNSINYEKNENDGKQ